MDISISISINNALNLSSGITPPLDLYTGAQTAYSIARKLRTAYTGDAIRVRESSGDTELDIGFDANGDLDETALLAHCGSNSGYVVTAYDQSGNSNDWTQATANKQPRIVNAGVVDKLNGKPTIYSDDTVAQQDNLTSTLTGSATTTAFHVMQSSRDKSSMNHGSGTAYYGLLQNGSGANNWYVSGTPSTFFNGSSIGATRDNLYDAVINNQSIVSFISLDLSNAAWGSFNTDFHSSDTFYSPDYIQETIIYDSDKSSDRAAIETNINDYYTIY